MLLAVLHFFHPLKLTKIKFFILQNPPSSDFFITHCSVVQYQSIIVRALLLYLKDSMSGALLRLCFFPLRQTDRQCIRSKTSVRLEKRTKQSWLAVQVVCSSCLGDNFLTKCHFNGTISNLVNPPVSASLQSSKKELLLTADSCSSKSTISS